MNAATPVSCGTLSAKNRRRSPPLRRAMIAEVVATSGPPLGRNWFILGAAAARRPA
jgi:hypothetical protein